MNVKHSPETLAAVKEAWESGVRDCVIMAAHNLPKGSLVSIIRRKGWKRPWYGLKALPVPARAYYDKLRRCGFDRAAAFSEMRKIFAASPVLPTAARLGPSVEPQPAVLCLPTGSPALNSEAAE